MSYAGESGPLGVTSEVRSFDLSSPEDTAAFAEILKEVDPQGTGCPNASVSMLVAALQAERRRADELQKDLDAAFEGWTDEASSAHRSSLDWQLRAGRYYIERNRARAERDLRERQLGDWQLHWGVGQRGADGIIDWPDRPSNSEGDARAYIDLERDHWGEEGFVLGARVVGDWYEVRPDTETSDFGPMPEITEEQAARFAADFEAAAAKGDSVMILLPPDC